MVRSLLVVLLLAVALPGAVLAAPPDHTPWTALLEAHVRPTGDGASTVVDYDGFARDRLALNRYLDRLSAVTRSDFDRWSADERLAFLINAYNGYTIVLVLSGWPDLKSIKDLGGWLRTPWEKRFFRLLGERRSLDDVEHGLIRGSGRYGEPRIHFAVNCASIGCPALRREAYLGDRLEEQLEDQARRFLGDESRNRVTDDAVAVSPLFKWYREDFTAGWRGADSLGAFLALYADALGPRRVNHMALEAGDLPVRFLTYDWRLNSASPPRER
ncbi:DUF547 domain-containing protein [Pseudohaliea rubra]|uniref:DUF547 domain-containing protein n=1 Tax=Pseudohaliea rubra DSM 19751 TaxID=1265313 RepID=A0A095VRH6_9GAMM|nr:DUF547 domain-containing protein [Pseudohaliea rubra]KGE03673.1 Uncharacterized protein HRUBRA_01764 [Pseudohaliea rubra DSM 19751]